MVNIGENVEFVMSIVINDESMGVLELMKDWF